MAPRLLSAVASFESGAVMRATVAASARLPVEDPFESDRPCGPERRRRMAVAQCTRDLHLPGKVRNNGAALEDAPEAVDDLRGHP